MTAIVGLVQGGRVYVGGDSAGIAGMDLTLRKEGKVYRVGEFVVGASWSQRPGHLIAHAFTPPPLPKRRGDLFRYMVVDFVDALRSLHRAHGWLESKNGRDSSDCFLLVGVRGALFRIESDYQVGVPAAGYDAVGCGGDFALGSLFSSRGQSPMRRLQLALRATERHSAGVRGPFRILSAEGRR